MVVNWWSGHPLHGYSILIMSLHQCMVLPGLEPQRSLHARAELSKDVNHNAHQVDFCFEYDERMEDGRKLGLCEMRQCTGR
jgi:hypothetical protein